MVSLLNKHLRKLIGQKTVSIKYIEYLDKFIRVRLMIHDKSSLNHYLNCYVNVPSGYGHLCAAFDCVLKSSAYCTGIDNQSSCMNILNIHLATFYRLRSESDDISIYTMKYLYYKSNYKI